MSISETDLILNADGSVYHLNLLPEDIAETVILVGDQDRVGAISKYFDSIELRKGRREFITHTGYLGNKWVSVVSTGIGTDNIDIVINELDALANINLQTRTVNKQLKKLNFIRIGTSGAIQPDIPVNSLLVSEYAFGLDALMQYYQHTLNVDEQELLSAFESRLPGCKTYISSCSKTLLAALGAGLLKGLTVTSPGFYSPQGRSLRAAPALPQLLQDLQKFELSGKRITNIEMETAGIYSLATALGHRALSFNVILANRINNTFSSQPAEVMENFITEILSRVISI